MKCYCCGNKTQTLCEAFLEDDDNSRVFVGPDCFKKIKASAATGYKSNKGGPLLFFPKELAVAYRLKTYR